MLLANPGRRVSVVVQSVTGIGGSATRPRVRNDIAIRC